MTDDDDMEARTILVKSTFGAAEYIALTQLAEAKGLSQAALVRMCVKEAVARDCAQQDVQSIDPKQSCFGTRYTFGDR